MRLHAGFGSVCHGCHLFLKNNLIHKISRNPEKFLKTSGNPGNLRDLVTGCLPLPERSLGQLNVEVAMDSTNCLDAFAEGERFAQQYTRTHGVYKFRERLAQWIEAEMEVTRIARAVCNPKAGHELRHCTPEDKHAWLKKAPIWVAYELGAYILPAFGALVGDGMPDADVRRLLPEVRSRIKSLVVDLHQAQTLVKLSIGAEYRRMRSGSSVIGSALSRARQELEAIVNLTPPNIQSQICPV
jgi:hypothetical protein